MNEVLGPLSFLHHVEIVVPDLNSAMDAYIAALNVGFSVFEVDETGSVFSGSSESFRLRIGVGSLGATAIELIQPVSGETIHSRFLAEKGPGLHHMGFWVASLRNATKHLEGLRYKSLMEGSIHGLARFAYYESAQLHCIIEPLEVELGFPVFLARHATVYGQKKPEIFGGGVR